MLYTIFAILTGLIVLVLYLGNKFAPVKKSRQEFLESLRMYVNGEQELIEGYPNSHRIKFEYEAEHFRYENIESKGFNENVYKSYLKLQTKSKLNLVLTERQREKIVGAGPMLVNEMVGQQDEQIIDKLDVPLELKQFMVKTNDITTANQLLHDWRAKRIFMDFKNIDARGRPFHSLRIIEGEIILEFHHTGSGHPKSLEQMNSFESVEGYLTKMLIVKDKIHALVFGEEDESE